MTAKSNLRLLPLSLLVLCAALAAGIWYLQPQRAMVGAAAALVLLCVMLALLFVPGRLKNGAARGHAENSVRNGVVLAALMLLVALSVKFALAIVGATGETDLALRATMATSGVILALYGNTIPKTLLPLSSRQCDAARVQASLRMLGWTWVLVGLAFAIVWLVSPVWLAWRMTFVLLPGAILLSVVQAVRARRTPGKTTGLLS